MCGTTLRNGDDTKELFFVTDVKKGYQNMVAKMNRAWTFHAIVIEQWPQMDRARCSDLSVEFRASCAVRGLSLKSSSLEGPLK